MSTLLFSLTFNAWFGAQTSAQTTTSPVDPSTAPTTWAVRISPTSVCADDQAFANTVSAQIPAANRASPEAAELVAEVTLIQGGLARIVVFDRVLQSEAGSRELQLNSQSCDDSAEAVSLVLAVLVEAGRGALGAAPAPKPPPPPPPPPEPEPLPPPAPPKKTVVRHPWLGPRAGHDLVAAASVGFGLLPSPAFGGTLEWGLRFPKIWPIYLQATGFRKDATGNVGARLSTVYGGVMTCPLAPNWEHFRMRGCAGAALGALWAEGVGLLNNYSRSKALYVLGIELAGSVPLVGPLEFTVLARGDAYPERYLFYYKAPNGRAWLHKSKPVSASTFAGFALRFR